MFSMIPKIGTFTFSNIATPFAASINATSCGVVTITAPDRATRCAIEIWMSPVPGGRSITMICVASHSTSVII